jgi:HD-GYP domain-containing protein (c-di-GMP phosphodiesterase class II)
MDKRQISVEELRVGMYVEELDRPWLETPFTYQGFPITSDAHIKMLKSLCKTVFIDVDRESTIDTHRKRASGAVPLHGTTIHPVGRPVEQELYVARDIFVACEASIAKAVESLKVEGNLDLEPLKHSVADMTRSIERHPDAMMLMSKIRAKGSYELGRAVDVSVLLITFGRFLQFSSDRLELLGLAGLLLDIGKVKIPDEILRKKGILTAQEYEVAKQHVVYSVELVREAGLPREIEDVIVQHHEREDGSGYPRGLRGPQISIDGALAGLVDTYSALTSVRSYAAQASSSNALGKLHAQQGRLFLQALVEQFIQCIGIYPVGSVVELNTGEVGIVVSQNLARRLQPHVLVILDRDQKPLRTQVMLDLMKDPKATADEPYRIRRALAKDKLPINPQDFFL